MAESLFDEYQSMSQECRQFCPSFGIFGTLNPPYTIPAANQNEIEIGDKSDLRSVILLKFNECCFVDVGALLNLNIFCFSVMGTFCYSDTKFPFCLSSENRYGSQVCCSFENMVAEIGDRIRRRQATGVQNFDIDLNN